MKERRSFWCRLLGRKLVIVRAGFPDREAWFARCDRRGCSCSHTRSVPGSPWPEDDRPEQLVEGRRS